MSKKIIEILFVFMLFGVTITCYSMDKPLRVGIVGMTHDHVHGILGRVNKGDIVIVGIAESNKDLIDKYSKMYGFDKKIVYSTIEEMLTKSKPEAVMAYNDIFGHLQVVEKCAPKGIHVMVEKPLAVSVAHLNRMTELARKYKIHLLTNYETTWYGSNAEAYKIAVDSQRIGVIRKIEFHTGHQGPVEIGCSKEFLAWLTDPVLNGAGALNDFGCYGVNISTWLMKGVAPVSVTAVTNTNKPKTYPNVDDEATIIIQYPETQVVIQASWNWPYSRKDMYLYGQSGYVFCKDGINMSVLKTHEKKDTEYKAPALGKDQNDAFSYFSNVVRGNIKPMAYDLSSLPNNEMVVKILEVAKVSAKTGRTIFWSEYYKN
ncbi:MAG: Gfo/Idh/MocA family protein [Paludibacteraceae bacterium]